MKNLCLIACSFLLIASAARAQEGALKPKLKIFVLAGQSNMEGKGSVHVMRHQLGVAEKRARFEHLQSNGEWLERDDVWIDYLGGNGQRHGRLTVGYGISKPGSTELFGPELGFGWTVGDHLDSEVLIIKTAWGGKSLDRDFRPPSRGYPESIEQVFEGERKNNEKLTMDEVKKSYGNFYRLMMEEVKTVTNDLKTYVPSYRDQGFEIVGFVWFQGWNDQYAPTSVEDYGENLAGLIHDVRKELNVPEMAIVIGAMGHDGANQTGKIKLIADAQAAVAELPEFNGRVITVRTAQFWDTEAESAYKKYWEDEPNRDVDKWREFGDDRGYHYFGSPVFFYDAGTAFGNAMLKLLKK